MSEKNVTDLSSGISPELARALEATPAGEDMREPTDAQINVWSIIRSALSRAWALSRPWAVADRPQVTSEVVARLDAIAADCEREVLALLRTPRGEGKAVCLLGLAMERAELLCQDAGRAEWPFSDFGRDMLQARLDTVRDLIGDALRRQLAERDRTIEQMVGANEAHQKLLEEERRAANQARKMAGIRRERIKTLEARLRFAETRAEHWERRADRLGRLALEAMCPQARIDDRQPEDRIGVGSVTLDGAALLRTSAALS